MRELLSLRLNHSFKQLKDVVLAAVETGFAKDWQASIVASTMLSQYTDWS